jgi:hypothetical protein
LFPVLPFFLSAPPSASISFFACFRCIVSCHSASFGVFCGQISVPFREFRIFRGSMFLPLPSQNPHDS